ncbi:hypothetical protein SDC9_193300 [bioreactor metagenome]|uniref:Uncharacterized protein n=1 Tax=bioreactor metagenome TaxID=1076179 RepID=A0A645I3P0_9ZZZZ
MSRNIKKSDFLSEKKSREFDKVNMEAAELMEMPSTDKMRKNGQGNPINQFR